MTCDKYRLLLHDLLDGELNPRTARLMAEHEAHCPYCAASRVEMRELLNNLANMDTDVEPPEEFSVSWRQMLRGERPPQRLHGRGTRVWIAVAAVLAILFGGTAIMRSYALRQERLDNERRSQQQLQYQNMSEGSDGGSSGGTDSGDGDLTVGGSINIPGLKILRNGNYSLQSNRFEEDVQSIQSLARQVGGWVAKQVVSGETGSNGRLCQLQLRVPDNTLQRFLTQLEMIGNLQSSELVAEDYSQQYKTLEAQLAGLDEQMDRLRTTLSQAATLTERLEIETMITSLQAQIDTGRAQLQGWDAHEVFAIVDVTLRESAYPVVGSSSLLGDRMKVQFARSLKAVSDYFKDMLVFMVIAAPWVMVVALLAGLALLVERLHWKSRQL